MSSKIIGLRLKSFYHGNSGFDRQGATVINAGLEKRDPALRNITEILYDKGLEFQVDGCNLYWFLIEDAHSCEHYLGFNEVEIAIESEWFEAEKLNIRGYAGARYYDACAEIAQQWPLKDQTRSIDYTLPARKVA